MKYKTIVYGVLILLLFTGFSGFSAAVPGAYGAHTYNDRHLALETPVWQQVNEDGFGDQDAEEVSALAEFNGSLYAATSNPTDGASIFRSEDGVTWTPVTLPGFGNAHDTRPPTILDLTEFKGRLYAGTGRGDGPGQIWRALDGVNWAPMTVTGFSNPDTVDFPALAEFNTMFYAGAMNLISGSQIWRSLSGDNNTWTKVAPEASQGAAGGITGMAVYDQALFAAVDSELATHIWRSDDGNAWTTVMNNGFGDPLGTSTGGMAAFGGHLYIGGGKNQDGAQLWRSDNGTTWDQVIDPGFGDPQNQKIELVFVFENQLYAGVENALTGMELWRSADGANWEQINQDGFGDSDNAGTNGSHAVAEFLGDLYVGTANLVDGGELWRLEGGSQPPTPPPPTPPVTPTPPPQHQYLPFTLRWP